jgi:hypothetical protein
MKDRERRVGFSSTNAKGTGRSEFELEGVKDADRNWNQDVPRSRRTDGIYTCPNKEVVSDVIKAWTRLRDGYRVVIIYLVSCNGR